MAGGERRVSQFCDRLQPRPEVAPMTTFTSPDMVGATSHNTDRDVRQPMQQRE